MAGEPGGKAICLQSRYAPGRLDVHIDMSRACAHTGFADVQEVNQERW